MSANIEDRRKALELESHMSEELPAHAINFDKKVLSQAQVEQFLRARFEGDDMQAFINSIATEDGRQKWNVATAKAKSKAKARWDREPPVLNLDHDIDYKAMVTEISQENEYISFDTKQIKGGKVCIPFVTSGCERGQQCKFYHPQSKYNDHARICVAFNKGKCTKGDNCLYSHEVIGGEACEAIRKWAEERSANKTNKPRTGQLRAEPRSSWKKSLETGQLKCRFWRAESPSLCKAGEACRFAHVE